MVLTKTGTVSPNSTNPLMLMAETKYVPMGYKFEVLEDICVQSINFQAYSFLSM
jgi:hypothetical protein